jgi:hypothetical protein
MKRFHIITPFWRKHNLQLLCSALDKAAYGCGDYLWYPVYDRTANCRIFSQVYGARPIYGEPHDCESPAWWKTNLALDAIDGDLKGDDYVGFLSDDDAYGAGLFAELEKQSAPLLMVTTIGHQHTPDEIFRFEANEENARTGRVTPPSFFVRGDFAKKYRMQNLWCAEGAYFESIKYHLKGEVLYLPHLESHYNLLPA